MRTMSGDRSTEKFRVHSNLIYDNPGLVDTQTRNLTSSRLEKCANGRVDSIVSLAWDYGE